MCRRGSSWLWFHGAAACDAVVAPLVKQISPSVRPGQEEQILRKAASSSHPYLPPHLTCFKLSWDPNITWFRFFRFRLWPPSPIPRSKDQDWMIKGKHPGVCSCSACSGCRQAGRKGTSQPWGRVSWSWLPELCTNQLSPIALLPNQARSRAINLVCMSFPEFF